MYIEAPHGYSIEAMVYIDELESIAMLSIGDRWALEKCLALARIVSCSIPWSIDLFDPDTLKVNNVVKSDIGAPTSITYRDGNLYLGSRITGAVFEYDLKLVDDE